MTDEPTLAEKARVKDEAKKLCFKDCAAGRHIDYENGCFTICKSAEQCQGWTAYTHRVPKAPTDDKYATIARLTAERDKWRSDCLDANASELSLRKRAEQAEAKLAEATAERDALRAQSFTRLKYIEKLAEAGTFAQGIEAAVSEIRKRWATTHAELEEYVRALSSTPQADPVREARPHIIALLDEMKGHNLTSSRAYAAASAFARALADERKEGE